MELIGLCILFTVFAFLVLALGKGGSKAIAKNKVTSSPNELLINGEPLRIRMHQGRLRIGCWEMSREDAERFKGEIEKHLHT